MRGVNSDAVLKDVRMSPAEPMTWTEAQHLAGDDLVRKYEEEFLGDAQLARKGARCARIRPCRLSRCDRAVWPFPRNPQSRVKP